MKFITEETYIPAKITKINISTYLEWQYKIEKKKIFISCHIQKRDYDDLMTWHDMKKLISVSFDDDNLSDFGINDYCPPFDISIYYITAQYTGAFYDCNIYFCEI